MKPRQGFFALIAIAALVASVARSGADDDKDKDKDKAAKAKPATRTYSDDDLKKYKSPPKEDGADAQPTTAAGDSGGGATDEAAPTKRRSREYGGYQEQPPTSPSPRAKVPAKVDSTSPDAPVTNDSMSPEESDWRRRAKQARAPIAQAEGRITSAESQIADLRDKLNPMSTKYVLGGNSNAGPGAILEVEEQLRNLDSELTEAKGAAAEAEKSWQAFLEEARAAGASPAWLNP